MRTTICQKPGTVPDGCVNEHFGALLSHTARMLRRAMDTRIAAEVTPELTGVRGMLLGEIICANNENRDVYQRDVEQWFHIRRSSVTAILQGMEQDGFITRCSVERDARLKRLAATPKGVAYHDRIRASIDRFEQDLQKGLTPAEVEASRVVLAQILHNAQRIEAETNKYTPERSNESC